MSYTHSELIFFFFVYSFIGWCFEVIVLSIRRRRFVDPGLLSGPICPQYGIAMDLILIFFPSLSGKYILQFIACTVIANAVGSFSSYIVEKTIGRRMWDIESRAAFSSLPGFVYTLAWGILAVLALVFFQPLVFILFHLMGKGLRMIVNILMLVIFAVDLSTVGFFLRHDRKSKKEGKYIPLAKNLRYTANSFGERINAWIHIRLEDAYPPILPTANEGKVTFAKGICFTKLFWMFLICALLGDVIETLFVGFTTGKWMSRSSLLYGPFSIVWGFGAVLLTIVLEPLAKKGDRYIFFGGFLLGGTYEYVCSVFTEIVFGKVFWDYSNMTFNIGGRTNLLFMFFWGVLSVVWIQILYPRISKWIEKIPILPGRILTWVFVLLMAINMFLSGMAIIRYSERQEGTASDTVIGNFLDQSYPDDMVEWVWPNMRDSSKVKK